MSASISPTRWPSRASAAARFAETVDFPTPPLPLEIARTLPRCGSSSGVGGAGGAGGRSLSGTRRVNEIHLDTRDTGHAFDGFSRLTCQCARIVARQHEREAHTALLIDGQIAHHTGGDEVPAVTRIGNAAERLRDAGFEVRRAHGDWPLRRKRRAAVSTFSSTSAIEPASEAPAAR